MYILYSFVLIKRLYFVILLYTNMYCIPPQPLQVTEPIPIGDWLTNYKLGDYTLLFEASGYDRTDFLLSITSDELVEIGVQKPGHKKKIMSAVSALLHKEHLIATKPVSGQTYRWHTLYLERFFFKNFPIKDI